MGGRDPCGPSPTALQVLAGSWVSSGAARTGSRVCLTAPAPGLQCAPPQSSLSCWEAFCFVFVFSRCFVFSTFSSCLSGGFQIPQSRLTGSRAGRWRETRSHSTLPLTPQGGRCCSLETWVSELGIVAQLTGDIRAMHPAGVMLSSALAEEGFRERVESPAHSQARPVAKDLKGNSLPWPPWAPGGLRLEDFACVGRGGACGSHTVLAGA